MVVAFDLDDTLFREMDYVRSAYRAIASRYGYRLLPAMLASRTPEEAFDSTGLPIDVQLGIYRDHVPDIVLPDQSRSTLEALKARGHTLAIVTDGRSGTQSRKIQALGLLRFVPRKNIFISEEVGESKTGGKPFRRLMEMYPGQRCLYVGDNPAKDIDAPRSLGWQTAILLGEDENIHPQHFDEVHPDLLLHSLTELVGLIDSYD